MSSSDDSEPLLANFLARHNPAKSNSSNSSLPDWIKAHQVRARARRRRGAARRGAVARRRKPAARSVALPGRRR
jgi:hypothetical protein